MRCLVLDVYKSPPRPGQMGAWGGASARALAQASQPGSGGRKRRLSALQQPVGHEVEHAVRAHAAAKMFFFLWMLPSESTMERRRLRVRPCCRRSPLPLLLLGKGHQPAKEEQWRRDGLLPLNFESRRRRFFGAGSGKRVDETTATVTLIGGQKFLCAEMGLLGWATKPPRELFSLRKRSLGPPYPRVSPTAGSGGL